jgi:hypothetical protein
MEHFVHSVLFPHRIVVEWKHLMLVKLVGRHWDEMRVPKAQVAEKGVDRGT